MNAIVNGRIVLPDGVVSGKALLYDRRVVSLADGAPAGCEIIDARGGYVIPGLIDMHIHGYMGEDSSDGRPEGLRAMAEGLKANGVTGFLPTTMTVSRDELRRAFACIRDVKAESDAEDWTGARILGLNAEGPFLNPKKKGAQAEEHILPGDPAFFRDYLDILRLVTIAPEMPGNLECVRELSEAGVLVSIGHTCATYDEAKQGFEAGVRHVTHLFNAQTGIHHRDPGVAGAALADDRVSCELIADTFHIHKGLFPLIARMKGRKLCLITDCLRSGGLPDGEYVSGGQKFVLKGIECRLADGTIAGSVLRLNYGVRNLFENTDLPLNEAVNAASLNPATALGMDGEIGSIAPGKRADLAILNGDFSVRATILGGRIIYQA